MYKLAISSGVFLAVLAIVSCYEFDDPYYNLILATDLEEMQDSLDYLDAAEHSRVRRDEKAVDKCHKKHFRACCSTKFTESFREEAKEHRKQCHREIHKKYKDADTVSHTPDPFNCDKIKNFRNDVVCLFQCMGQKFNLVDAAGNIKDAPYKAFVADNFKESWLVPRLNAMSTKCLSEARNATIARGKTNSDGCNPAIIKAVHCMFKEIQMVCPDEQIQNLKTCAKFRARVEKHEGQELLPVKNRV